MTPLLTVEDVLPVLRISRRELSRLYAELGAVKLGRSVRFTEAGLSAYLERQRVQAPPPRPKRQERPQTRLRALPARPGVGLVTGRKREAAR